MLSAYLFCLFLLVSYFTAHSTTERFSYDLEMKTREQNRNNKRMEIERFDWFIEQTQTRVALSWLSKRSKEKNFMPHGLNHRDELL